MKHGGKSFLLLLSLLLPCIVRANDDASIYPVAPAAVPVTAPAKTTSNSVRLSLTPDAAPKLAVPASTPAAAPVAPKPTTVSAPVPVATSTITAVSSSLPPSSGKTYKVKAGDNLYRIGKANGTTLEAIKAINNLKSDTLRIGQVLVLPKAGFSYRPPQPVQKPIQYVALPTPTPAPAPVTPTPQVVASVPAPAPAPTPTPQAPSQSIASTSKLSAPAVPTIVSPTPQAPAAVAKPAPVVATTTPTPSPSTAPISPNSVVRIQPTLNDSQARLMAESENLAKLDLGYDESWQPPGERTFWDMDCSNTSRYLYKKAVGIQLPRCASDQYYDLKIQNKAWDVPLDSNDQPDLAYLERNLRVGDLLFWENTYKPERNPPITHVTIFLGKDAKGNWIMAGSQSASIGKYGTRRGGPDIYIFDPLKTAGGYSTWFGFVRKKGHFVAFGRPLAQSPVAVATSR